MPWSGITCHPEHQIGYGRQDRHCQMIALQMKGNDPKQYPGDLIDYEEQPYMYIVQRLISKIFYSMPLPILEIESYLNMYLVVYKAFWHHLGVSKIERRIKKSTFFLPILTLKFLCTNWSQVYHKLTWMKWKNE